MTYFDAYSDTNQLLGSQGELLARIADFLERKSRQVPDRVEAFCQAIESRVRSFDIRDSLRAVLAQFRRSPAPTSEIAIGDDQEWDALVIMIREYGREETIENYSAFLFPF